VSFQIFWCVRQTLVDEGKSGIDVLVLDILAHLFLPIAGRLRGEKLHETD